MCVFYTVNIRQGKIVKNFFIGKSNYLFISILETAFWVFNDNDNNWKPYTYFILKLLTCTEMKCFIVLLWLIKVGIDCRKTESTHIYIETLLNNAKGTPEGRERGNMVACAPAMITLKCDVYYGNNISLLSLLLLFITNIILNCILYCLKNCPI